MHPGKGGKRKMAGTNEGYQRRIQSELSIHKEALLEKSEDGLIKTPAVWSLAEDMMARKIMNATGGLDSTQYVISELEKRQNPKILSLGSGACALELKWVLPFAKNCSSCTLECIDLNPDLMEEGRRTAESMGVQFIGTAMDINKLVLEPEKYDVIMVWSALHHFIELDHIAAQINRGLKSDGVFVTMDICARNGYLLWPETKVVVDEFYSRLPDDSYRIAHTLGPISIYCDEYPNRNLARNCFECIRSEDVVPALEKNLERVHLIFAHTFCRRFFDQMFGPNFDLSREFDRQFVNEIVRYDEKALRSGQLKPETFYGVYKKKI
jgi:ubiquinone/menaquinone biosynthesis C-methylase UbiE